MSVPEDALPDAENRSSQKIPLRELLELILPDLPLGCLRLGLPVPRTEELLLKLDEQPVREEENDVIFPVGPFHVKSTRSKA